MMKPKHLIALLLFFLPSALLARHVAYEIRGTVKNFEPGQKIYLRRYKNNIIVDSLSLTNGAFVFKGETDVSDEPEANYIEAGATLLLDHSGKGISFGGDIIMYTDNAKRPPDLDNIRVYLDSGVTEVTTTDSVKNAVIIPPKINQGHYQLDSIYSAYFKKMNQWFRQTRPQNLPPAEYLKQEDRQRRIFMAEQGKDKWQFVKDHPDSPVSLYILKHDEEYYPTYKHLHPYFAALSPGLKATRFGRTYAAMLDTLKWSEVGRQAPDFVQNDKDGNPVALSSFKGKYVLIDFWASWCGPCRAQNPAVVKAYEQFKDKNFTILGVSLDTKQPNWLQAMDADHLAWTQVSDLQGWGNTVAHLYSVGAIPQNFLIDPQGKIIAHNLFGKRLAERLAKILTPDASGDKQAPEKPDDEQ